MFLGIPMMRTRCLKKWVCVWCFLNPMMRTRCLKKLGVWWILFLKPFYSALANKRCKMSFLLTFKRVVYSALCEKRCKRYKTLIILFLKGSFTALLKISAVKCLFILFLCLVYLGWDDIKNLFIIVYWIKNIVIIVFITIL